MHGWSARMDYADKSCQGREAFGTSSPSILCQRRVYGKVSHGVMRTAWPRLAGTQTEQNKKRKNDQDLSLENFNKS